MNTISTLHNVTLKKKNVPMLKANIEKYLSKEKRNALAFKSNIAFFKLIEHIHLIMTLETS